MAVDNGRLSFKGIGTSVNAIVTAFGAYELLPKYGALALTAAAIAILGLWLSNGYLYEFLRLCRNSTGFFMSNVFNNIRVWWQPVLAILILIGTWGAVGLGKLHVSFGIKDIHYFHQSIKLRSPKLARDKFPDSASGSSSDNRSVEKIEFDRWKHWMARGVGRSGGLFSIESHEFDDEYDDFTSVITIDSSYEIEKIVAFLKYDEKLTPADQNYRVRYRQMKCWVLSGSHSACILLERPQEHERVAILLHVVPKQSGEVVDISECFVSDELKVE